MRKKSHLGWKHLSYVKDFPRDIKISIFPKILKNWVGVQRDQSYLMGRRCKPWLATLLMMVSQ